MMSPRPPLSSRIATGRTAWAIVAALLAVYVAAFLLTYPRTITVIDELSYVRQAQLLVTGIRSELITDPSTGLEVVYDIRQETVYPLGTALTLAPFIAAGGWPLAFFAPALCLLLATLVTARWLADAGRSPLAAGVLLGFPAALVLGRVCMSEAPSLLCVSLGLWLFWRGLDKQRVVSWLAAGFLAGGSILFRESNVLLLAPFLLGAVLRRDGGTWALAVGAACGVGLRLLSSQLYFGDAFYQKASGYGFGFGPIARNLPIYATSLLLFVPGGLLAGMLYKGPRRAEVVATIVGFFLFYLTYDYSGGASGLAKRIILGPRYFVPLLPLLAFALAEVVPRTVEAAKARWPARRETLAGLASLGLVSWLAGVAVAEVGAHVTHSSWSASQAAIRQVIYDHTPEGAIIVGNSGATAKFIHPVYGPRLHLDRDYVSGPVAARILARNDVFYLLFLDRSDSDYWRRDARQNEFYLKTYNPRPPLVLEMQVTPTDHLRIFEVREVRGGL